MAQIVIGEAGFDMTTMVVASTVGDFESVPDTITAFMAPYQGGTVVAALDPSFSAIVSVDLFAGDDPSAGEPLFSAFGLAIPGDLFGSTIVDKDDPAFLAALLTGDDGISGGPGNDLLIGQLGNDTVRGNDGDDLVGGGVGDDQLLGGIGNDGVDGGDGNDIMFGGIGNDRMIADDGIDLVYGEEGEDLIGGGAGDDALLGGAGNDILDGSDYGDDNMAGGDGDDTLALGRGSDSAEGGTGADIFVLRIAAEGASPENDTIGDLEFADGDRLRNDTGIALDTLLATATVTDGNTTLTYSEGDTVTINGLAAINADYFV